jgi:cytoskeletal protein RodZ
LGWAALVSAILKALRRVENESVLQSETPAVPKKFDAKKAIRDHYKKNWTTQKFLIVLLPLLTLAMLIWVLFSYKPFLMPKSSTAAVKSNPPPAKQSAKPPALDNRRKWSEAASPSGASPTQEERTTPRGASKEEKKGTADTAPAQQEGPSVEDPEFKLQAIVWSEVPESRFAVINGVIVRAGGKIEDVSVIDIGKDFVSFKSGQRTWKMKMMTE